MYIFMYLLNLVGSSKFSSASISNVNKYVRVHICTMLRIPPPFGRLYLNLVLQL
eukprot:SAG31_NODE_190_length_20810_cov_20.296364_9_plen_54_part_00